ncbi:excinuclease ABC subunit UvrA [Malacoplasma penetrans]|uniref:UvrABC system protein A n=1 Tax=Malacoplasma penetrans (strain HF-2) TaxID=272633 RepID=UVRA_MALP2|nr:excinuclease ABC subunit UvrA [Malacoplasma penetrans]Q8EUL1.1 RecName: Full=UvrABC system protein A; Short=UvrA protein; AltName: Full=Excinuclease ABC subunit A [Malacoplasma penetrans HF-2]RXY97114.1 excinuclease ABC subunit UvrA [Malacoplasma penetrans]BAC44701.1 excinuclease ABC subunit A [Malacoplasma penetrans HF-2]
MNNKVNTRDFIVVKGARENNLKNVDIDIPKNKFVVMTGLSGSGKSSLAFDTIYAEGQRRYLESLSSYARQFLGGNEKPDVDSIEGLSPAISIDQKTTSHNPRSTVGTVTEIYDYLRLLFSRIGKPYCPNGHGLISTLSIKQMIDTVYENKEESKIQILSPIISQEKGTFKNKIEELKRQGYLRLRIDGNIYSLDDEIELEKTKKHNIDILIDRIILNNDTVTRSRIYDAIEKSVKEANGKVIVLVDDKELFFSQNHACNECGFSIPELEPRFFSFNSPVGACKSCNGIGFNFLPDTAKIVPDPSLSIKEGAIAYFRSVMMTPTMDLKREMSVWKEHDINLDVPFKELSKKEKNIIFYGDEDIGELKIDVNEQSIYSSSSFLYNNGLVNLIMRRFSETQSERAREYYEKFMSNLSCPSCNGQKLSIEALSVKINNKNIIDLTEKNINDLTNFFIELELNETDRNIAHLALKEIVDRLSFLENVGLNYLTLSRSASTLSGGESQRIRLATQIGSSLTGVLYVLDEPSIGLHQKDNEKLIETLKKMRDLGNTLIVVEHDEDTIRASDYLIDIGPKAGDFGGEVVAAGTVSEVSENKKSITAQYLSGKLKIEVPSKRRHGNGKTIELVGASGNNLKNVTVSFPLNKLIAVTGVSGSGKSTLINETLIKGIEKKLTNPFIVPAPFKDIKGLKNVDKIIKVSQDPIGRTPRSNPATYVSVFDDIRDLFANTKEAKARGFQKGRFSFNVSGGRCENCSGDGLIKIEMHFLPDVFVKCESCNGKKYNQETLQVLYKGKSIYDVLEMSVVEARDFFYEIPEIKRKLDLMVEVGIDYLKLGTSSTHLSGGEAQRIKLAKYLQKRATGKTIYVLDEPTTGLHIHDIAKLITVLNRIVDNGDTVIVVEHNLDLIKCADYVIDLGPDGGINGGQLVAYGTPEEIIEKKAVSYTGLFLEKNMYKDK